MCWEMAVGKISMGVMCTKIKATVIKQIHCVSGFKLILRHWATVKILMVNHHTLFDLTTVDSGTKVDSLVSDSSIFILSPLRLLMWGRLAPCPCPCNREGGGQETVKVSRTLGRLSLMSVHCFERGPKFGSQDPHPVTVWLPTTLSARIWCSL